MDPVHKRRFSLSRLKAIRFNCMDHNLTDTPITGLLPFHRRPRSTPPTPEPAPPTPPSSISPATTTRPVYDPYTSLHERKRRQPPLPEVGFRYRSSELFGREQKADVARLPRGVRARRNTEASVPPREIEAGKIYGPGAVYGEGVRCRQELQTRDRARHVRSASYGQMSTPASMVHAVHPGRQDDVRASHRNDRKLSPNSRHPAEPHNAFLPPHDYHPGDHHFKSMPPVPPPDRQPLQNHSQFPTLSHHSEEYTLSPQSSTSSCEPHGIERDSSVKSLHCNASDSPHLGRQFSAKSLNPAGLLRRFQSRERPPAVDTQIQRENTERILRQAGVHPRINQPANLIIREVSQKSLHQGKGNTIDDEHTRYQITKNLLLQPRPNRTPEEQAWLQEPRLSVAYSDQGPFACASGSHNVEPTQRGNTAIRASKWSTTHASGFSEEGEYVYMPQPSARATSPSGAPNEGRRLALLALEGRGPRCALFRGKRDGEGENYWGFIADATGGNRGGGERWK